ncbi:MAG: copper chaperone PCu(A)C [Microthrixaceae bacterium]
MRFAARSLAVATTVVVTSCAGGAATPDELTVTDVWARPTSAGADDGVVYLTIVSPTADTLLSAEVPGDVAGATVLHESMLMDGDGGGGHHDSGAHHGGGSTPGVTVPLPPDEPVQFAPGGLHVMLESLGRPLLEGDRFPLTLRFETAGEVRAEARVMTNPS